LPGVSYPEYDLNGGQSTNLAAPVGDSTTTIPVDSTAGWPGTGYFMIDAEELTYTGLTATSFTGVVRATNGTTAAAHADSAIVSRSRIITVSEGPNAGLAAQVIPFDLTVTAVAGGGSEARLNREVQVALIPVFQFGIFSDSDLSFFAGPDFNFGGRVHTNGDLYLAEGGGNTLSLSQKVSAVGDVIRTELANGNPSSTNHGGTVRAVTSPGNYRNLGTDEGSLEGGPGSDSNAAWPGLSLTTYNGNLLNGDTGAKPLTLPFAGGGASPVEIIRRGPPAEDPTSILGQSRLYNQSSVRVLLSDSATGLPGGSGYPLTAALSSFPYSYSVDGTHPPFAMSDPADSDHRTYLDTQDGGNPSVGGYLRVDIQRDDGTWQDVTMEVLNLGISRNNPDAILKFQRLRIGATAGSTTPTDYWPNKLFDPREGEFRDTSYSTMSALGIIGTVDLDVTNLRRWLDGDIGVVGDLARNNQGYIFYFSDRRGNRDNTGSETAEFGFEDFVDAVPDGGLDTGEDVNQSGSLETYGANIPVSPYTNTNALYTVRFDIDEARESRVHYFRRALRLINGGGDTLPDPGFTVASENPVYVQGDYNASGGFAGTHSAAAVIADAVMFLSNAWDDDTSFAYHHSLSASGRQASTTYYRMALAAGKGRNFPYPSGTGWDFGTDGGVHNFFRYMENWSGQTLNYLGSIVSLYYSRQAVGTYKCCSIVYSPPTRNFTFDTEFLVPSQLPPGTPRFRDINNLSFRQTILAD